MAASRVVIARPALYTFGLFSGAAMLIFVDHSPSNIAKLASLLVLILGAATLGMAAPRWAWLAALAIGGSLAAMHAIYLAAQVRLPYQMSPVGWAGAPALLILIIPAASRAYLGAGAVVLVQRRRSRGLDE